MLTAFLNMETESCWIIPEKETQRGGEFQNNHEYLEPTVCLWKRQLHFYNNNKKK